MNSHQNPNRTESMRDHFSNDSIRELKSFQIPIPNHTKHYLSFGYYTATNSVLCTTVSAFRKFLLIKAFGTDLWQHITIKRFSFLTKYFPFVSHFYFALCFHSYGFRIGYTFDSFSSLKSFSCFHMHSTYNGIPYSIFCNFILNIEYEIRNLLTFFTHLKADWMLKENNKKEKNKCSKESHVREIKAILTHWVFPIFFISLSQNVWTTECIPNSNMKRLYDIQ